MASATKVRGYGSTERPLATEMWKREAHRPDHPALSAHGNFEPDNHHVDHARYFDPARAQDEVDHVWTRNWLLACREEDIPEIGDRVPLQVGSHSYFIIRSGEDHFKAFHNSCLHRGTLLCSKKESAETIRCPYHAWEWNADGRLKKIPSHWDFPEITRNNGSLPEIRLERWGGFIFVNADKDAAPLSEALHVVPEHFREFAPERRYTAARFRKLVRANWKITQEAFQEAYHLYATHPEAVPFTGDAQGQYEIWSGDHGHVGRNLTCSAIPSMHAPNEDTALKAGMMFAQGMCDWHYPQEKPPVLDESGDIRAQLGAWHREVASRVYGRAIDLPDAVMLDSPLYFVYPHACFWLSEAVPFVYQFLPHESDPEMSYFDVRVLLPGPDEGPLPPAAPAIELDADQSVFAHCPDFGFLGYIFDQDMSNMPLIQKGAHSADPEKPHTRLSAYQEMIIQHWNKVMDEQIAKGKTAKT
ncbi:aromatic ring-hydroxylating dioxygenase subunit alpha (plasmid) [Sphingobium sp. SJ10-10]|uniref:aromatic ring-hydroxylating oxygenase subunit alpha n=1 Tax=Sphingobium sp. SJ10-10 TaxID=3114999 RepID=UPI002E17DFEA|nr:aromatic ring-hydroxylating dioxygenase subunit alpha [Sphingobium sp. SJ10-10]